MRLGINALCGGGFIVRRRPPPLGIGYIAGGFSTAPAALVDRYQFSTKSVLAAPSLGQARFRVAGAGNTVKAVFRGGTTGTNTSVNSTDEITYASNTRASGGALLTPLAWLSAIGVDEFALYMSGYTGSAYSSGGERYSYATSTSVGIGGLATPRGEATAAGNASVGVVVGGYGGAAILTSSEEVSFSTLAVTFRGSISSGRFQLASGSSAQSLVVSGGALSGGTRVTSTEVYSFAAGTFAASTAAATARYGHTALSDSFDATFMYGATGLSANNVNVRAAYTFANGAWTSLSNIGTARRQIGSAASDSAGGLV